MRQGARRPGRHVFARREEWIWAPQCSTSEELAGGTWRSCTACCGKLAVSVGANGVNTYSGTARYNGPDA